MALHPIVNIAVNAAQRAERIILKAYDALDTIEVIRKRDSDLVTDVDRAAEEAIISCIRESYPEHGFLAEESGEQSGSEVTWIIDPIDGTTNFIHGFPHFCISIAAQQNGRIEHGVVYDPIKKDLFTASRGRGAQLNGRRIRVANLRSLDQALIGTGFPFRNSAALDKYLPTFQSIFQQCGGIRRAGSAALDLAYVASGRLDGYWEFGLNIWDIAAGSLLITEAGGLVGDFEGGASYLASGNIVAGNPRLFKNLLQTIAKN